MKIVIDIHEKDYQSMLNGNVSYGVLDAIKNGTPLPKGHGKIIDVNDLLDRICLDNSDETRKDNVGELITLEDIDLIPALIEADNESEE